MDPKQQFVLESLDTVGKLYEATQALMSSNTATVEAFAKKYGVQLAAGDAQLLINSFKATSTEKLNFHDLFTSRLC